MSQFVIKQARRSAKKLRIGIESPSGYGKTYSSLLLAKGIVGDLSKVCVIDTEKESASLYDNLGKFYTIQLEKPFSPDRYIAALKQIEDNGFELAIMDSISHEWAGPGGCLDILNSHGGSFQDWGYVTPLHNNFINAILTSKIHVITTIRKKQGYAIEQGAKGFNVKKMGLQNVQRDGFEYELDVNFDIINDNHYAKPSKDRTSLFNPDVPFVISEATGAKLRDWSINATDDESNIQLEDAMNNIRMATSPNLLKKIITTYPELKNNPDFVTAMKARVQYFKDIKDVAASNANKTTTNKEATPDTNVEATS